ncbi:MAG: hypothetical protein ACOYB3_00070 [Azonexus sp.]
MTLAEHIIGILLEDRIDDLIARYPDLKLNRPKLEQWIEFDPTNNKKYFQWIVKQAALKKVALPKGGERLRDDLMRFERLLSLPAFTGQRDINQYDAKTLAKTVKQTANLQSKTEKEKEERFKNVKVVGKAGNIYVVEIKHAQELMNRSWQGYSKDNPNWDGKPLTPPRPGSEDTREWDGLWCVRFPQYSRSYLADGPFYMVYKNDGVYAGIMFERGECQDLHNKGISMGMAEEIYPALKPIIDQKAKEGHLERNCSIFVNMRFLNGEAKDGESVSGQNNKLDLSFSSLKALPNQLTVRGTLDLTGCQIAQLPASLSVTGGVLKIAGTRITQLPLDLQVDEMEWSEPLPLEEVKKLFYRMRLGEMKKHFWKNPKLYVPEVGPDGQPIMITQRSAKTGMSEKVPKPKLDASGQKIEMDEQMKEKAWIDFQPELIKYFLTHEQMDKSAKAVLHYISPENLKTRQRNE